MEQEKNFFAQLEILAQLPSQEGQNRAVRAVFGAIRYLIDADGATLMEMSLPEWLRAQWAGNLLIGARLSDRNILDLIKTSGNYAYRGAAQRVLLGVLGGLVEVLDQAQRERVQRALPIEVIPFWDQANTCSLNATAGQFL